MAQAYGAAFAQLYNRQSSGFAQDAAPALHDFFLAQRPPRIRNAKLLDVCCGTGQLARYFLERNFTVTGIDLSEAMLALARQNNQGYIDQGSASFVAADASDFALTDSFDFVVSTYDALNHLPDLTALEGCFASVAAVTAENGWFVFDLNTRGGIRRWNGIMVKEDQDGLIIQRGFYDDGDRAQMLITGFVPGAAPGCFQRFEESVYNTVYNLADVSDLLRATGWTSVHFARLAHLDVPVEKSEDESRIWVVARR